jgi:IclR family transcriptional regulator, KDG regulon repressor
MTTTAAPKTARDRPPEEAAEDTSFARGLRILLTVADRRAIRADELSTLLDTPLSTVYRYLRTLGEFGFVERNGTTYGLGPRLLIGGGANVTTAALVQAADPILRMLTGETGETATLMRRIGLTAVCLAAAQPSTTLRVAIEPGAVFPLHVGPTPRVLLAYAPPEVVDELLADVRAGRRDAVDEAGLRDDLARIVATGIARGHDEASSDDEAPGVVTIAVPILRGDGIAGAIGVSGPSSRCDDAWRDRATRLLVDASANIRASLADRSP